MRKLYILILGLLYSALIGAISFLFLTFEHLLIKLIWEYIPEKMNAGFNIYIAAVITFLSVIIYMIKKNHGNVPETGGEALSRFKKEAHAKKYNIGINIVSSLLILAMGAGVGPEAALLGIIVSLSIWQADKLRYVYYNFKEYRLKSIKEKIHIFITYNDFLVSRKKTETSRKKKFLQMILIINGIVAFFLLKKFSDQPGFITRLGVGGWKLSDLRILGIVSIYGVFLGIIYRLLKRYVGVIFEKFIKKDITRIFIGGLTIYLVCLFNRDLLFSGQTTLPQVVKYGQILHSSELLIFAFIKMLLLIICLKSGLKGGDIFPLLFIGLLQGFSIANVYTSIDYLVILAAATVSFLAIASDEFIIAMIFMSLFFPPSYSLIIYPVGILLFFLIRYSKKITEKIRKKHAVS